MPAPPRCAPPAAEGAEAAAAQEELVEAAGAEAEVDEVEEVDEAEEVDEETEDPSLFVDADEALGWRERLADAVLAPFDCAAPLSALELSVAVRPVSAAVPGAQLASTSPGAVAVVLAVLVAAREALRRGGGGSASAESVQETIEKVGRPVTADGGGKVDPAVLAKQREEAARKIAEQRQKDAVQKERDREEWQRALKEEEQRMEEQRARKAEEEKAEAERQARLKEELRERAKREKEERERRIAAEEEAKRKKVAEEKAARERAEKERLAKLEAERKAREEAFLARGGQRFTLRLKGEAEVRAPSKSDARLRVTARAVGVAGAPCEESLEARGVLAAREAARGKAAAATRAATDSFASDARLKEVLGDGPLKSMDDAELVHWMRLAQVRAEADATSALYRCAASLEVGGATADKQEWESSTSHAVLPPEDPESLAGVVRAVLDAAAEGDGEAAVERLREAYALDRRELLAGSAAPSSVTNAALLGAAITAAHVIDRASDAHEAGTLTDEALELCAAAAEVVVLEQTTDDATWHSFFLIRTPAQGREEAVAATEALIGADHPVSLLVRKASGIDKWKELEEQRAARARPMSEEEEREARRRALEYEKSQIPVPERVWANRNTALSMRQGGALEQARELLEECIELMAGFLGSEEHPALLWDMLELAGILERRDEWAEDAREARARFLSCAYAVAERFVERGEPMDALVVLWASAAEQGRGVLAADDPAVARLAARADAIAAPFDDKVLVPVRAAASRDGIIAALTKRFAPRLEAYREAGSSVLEQW